MSGCINLKSANRRQEDTTGCRFEPYVVSSEMWPECWFSDEEEHNAGTAVFTSSFTLIVFVLFSDSGNIKRGRRLLSMHAWKKYDHKPQIYRLE